MIAERKKKYEKKNKKLCRQVEVELRLLTCAVLHDGCSIASLILENLKPRKKEKLLSKESACRNSNVEMQVALSLICT